MLKISQRVTYMQAFKGSSLNTPDKKSDENGGTDDDGKNDINSSDIEISSEKIIVPFLWCWGYSYTSRVRQVR